MESPDIFYVENIKVLEVRFSEIAEYLKNYSYDSACFCVEEFDGQKKLIANYNDSYLQMDSLYDSDILNDLWINSHSGQGYFDNLFFLFGIGSGAFVRRYLQIAPKDARITIYEPAVELFSFVIHEYDFTDIFTDNRVTMFLGPAMKEKMSFAFEYKMSYADTYNFKKYCLPNYDLLYREEYKAFLYDLDIARMSIQGDMALFAKRGNVFNKNSFANAKYLINSKSLDNLKILMPDDFPAIVVAAGPSLDKNIEQLKNVGKRALIIATDTALKPLAKAGIVADVVVSMDALKDNNYFSDEISLNIPLVCDLTVGTKITNVHKGIKFFSNARQKYIQDYLDENDIEQPILMTGGSVANDALSLARLLGANRIILIGQDLAYTDDKTHSDKTVEGELPKEKQKFEKTVMDVDVFGNPIRTAAQFIMYRNWIERMIKVDDGRIEYIDATEGGILIRGSKIMTLKDAIERECTTEIDFADCFKKVSDLFDDNQKESFVTYMKKLPCDILKIGNLADAAINVYDNMKTRIINDDYTVQDIKLFAEKSKTLFDEISEMSSIEYVRNITQEKDNEIMRSIGKETDDEKQNLLSACHYGRYSMLNIKTAASELIPEIESYFEEWM